MLVAAQTPTGPAGEDHGPLGFRVRLAS